MKKKIKKKKDKWNQSISISSSLERVADEHIRGKQDRIRILWVAFPSLPSQEWGRFVNGETHTTTIAVRRSYLPLPPPNSSIPHSFLSGELIQVSA